MYGDGVTKCLRGSDTLTTVYLAIVFLLVVAITVFCTGAMVVSYRSVYQQDQTMAQYRRRNTHQEAYARSRSIQTKMLLYTSTFCVCWILALVILYTPGFPPALWLVRNALCPLMGFLRMLVFILLKCRMHQKSRSGTGLPAAYFHVLLAAPLSEIWQRATARTAATTSADVGSNLWAVDTNVGAGGPHGSSVRETGEVAAARVVAGRDGAGGTLRLRTGPGSWRRPIRRGPLLWLYSRDLIQ